MEKSKAYLIGLIKRLEDVEFSLDKLIDLKL